MGLSLALGSEITSPKARLRAISMTLEVFGQNASPRVIRTLVVVPSVMDPKRLLLPLNSRWPMTLQTQVTESLLIC